MYRNQRRVREMVLADMARTGHPVVTRRAEVEAEFGDLDTFLLALHHRWWTALEARVDGVLEDEPPDPGGAVAAAATRLAGPDRLLLDAYAERPALGAAERVRRRRLADLAGIDPGVLDRAPAPADRRGPLARLAARLQVPVQRREPALR